MKLKLFLPLAIVCLILDGYLFTLWLPKITNQQIATVRALNQRELKALADTRAYRIGARHNDELELLDGTGRVVGRFRATPQR